MRKISREKRTVEFMIRFYCRHKHGKAELCHDCRELLAYSLARLDRCPFGDGKNSCRRCSVHCYSSDMRQRIRAVMRYAGPRMFLLSPLEAFRHM